VKIDMNSLDLPFFKKTDELLREIKESKPDLAEPLIFFADRQEAEWAFDLVRWTLETLGVKNTEDRRFAITLPQDKKRLRLLQSSCTRFFYS
jgi:hypothetical protein